MKIISKISGYIWLAGLFAACLCGCSSEKEDGPGDIPAYEKERVTIQLQIAGGTLGTRAAGEFDSGHIETLNLFVFEEKSGELLYRPEPLKIDLANSLVEIEMRTTKEDRHYLVLVANASNEIESIFQSGTPPQNYTELRTALKFDITHRHNDIYETIDTDKEFGAERYLPMWGQTEPLNVPADIKTISTIYMLRSLATVTVVLDLENTAEQKDFEMTHVVIYNVPDKGYVIPNPDPTYTQITYDGYEKSVIVLKPTIEELNAVHSKAYYEVPSDEALVERIFIGEKDNTAAGMSADERTWLVVGGIYDNSGTVTWYRLPLIDTEGKQWNVLRNHNYIYKIKRVTGKGSIDEDGAEEADIYAEVVPWNEENFAFDIDGVY